MRTAPAAIARSRVIQDASLKKTKSENASPKHVVAIFATQKMSNSSGTFTSVCRLLNIMRPLSIRR
jgi:hypothetical protein